MIHTHFAPIVLDVRVPFSITEGLNNYPGYEFAGKGSVGAGGMENVDLLSTPFDMARYSNL